MKQSNRRVVERLLSGELYTAVIDSPYGYISGAARLASAMAALLPDEACILGVPGTPTTEVIEKISLFRKENCSASVNELDLLGYLIGANSRGRPTVAVMKHNGALVCQELLSTLGNHELRAPMVIVVGDEPGASSQIGTDTRFQSELHGLPLIEPSLLNLSQCFAFSLSLSSIGRRPVIFRVTPEVMYTEKQDRPSTHDVSYWVSPRQDSLRDYFAVESLFIERAEWLRSLFSSPWVKAQLQAYPNINSYEVSRESNLVISSGSIADRVKDLVRGLPVNHFEINTPSILDDSRLISVLCKHRRVLVLENWIPYIEQKLRLVLQRHHLFGVLILGRESNFGKMPFISEHSREIDQNNLLEYLKSFVEGCSSGEEVKGRGKGNYPLCCVPQSSQRGYLSVYNAFYQSAKTHGLDPCLSVSTGRTRYSVMGTRFESMVKFMPPMGTEVMALIGYLDSFNETTGLAPAVILGDYTFVHSAWKGVTQLGTYSKKTRIKVPSIILENQGSQTTGGQSCEKPEEFGVKMIAHWKKRYAGTVSANNRLDLLNICEVLLNARDPRDIAVVRLES